MNNKVIKVLVIDDSIMFRELLVRNLNQDSCIQVIGSATDPYDASNKLESLEPDVITLDVNMPRMNGIDFLKKLMAQYPIPVVIISSSPEHVLDALNAGAVDYVTKVDAENKINIDSFLNEVKLKVKIASVANFKRQVSSVTKQVIRNSVNKTNCKVIAIGASTGGTEAIVDVITPLPDNLPGIVVVQHMPPVFTRMYAERLNNTTRLKVKEAVTGDLVLPGTALIAPGDFQLKIKKAGEYLMVECFKGEKVNGHCPSVDVMFESVAKEVGKYSIGVILTGMGYDGAKGILTMKKNGAKTIGQDEASCVVYGMPKVAYEIGGVEKQCTLSKIPEQIMHFLSF